MQKIIGFKAQKAKVKEKLYLELHKNEDLKRITIGYDESAVIGVVLETEIQKKSLGNVMEGEFLTEINHLGTGLAIVGFEASFDLGKMIELSVLSAPISKTNKHPAVYRRYKTDCSFAIVNEELYARERYLSNILRDEREITSAFTEYKKYPKSVSR